MRIVFVNVYQIGHYALISSCYTKLAKVFT